MINLSPAAQVVLDAYMTNCGWLDGPLEDDYRCAVAVLQAAADQVMPEEPTCSDTYSAREIRRAERMKLRKQFLAIADELEGQ